MDNKKWEELIDLVINENQDKASELFHEIIVEKSRVIFESLMDEDMMDESKEEDEEDAIEEAKEEDEEDAIEESMMDEMDMEEGGMGGQVGDLLDEINAEESGVMEDNMDFDHDAEEMGHDLTHDLEAGHDEEDLEDRVVNVEDKLDELMAEFEKLMGKEGEEHGEEEAGEEDFEMGPEGEEEEEEEEEVTEDSDEDDMDESVMENVNLPKVPGVKHGDDGANAKSPALHEPRVKAEGVKPVKFSGQQETVPTSPKGPSNAYSKGEGKLPGAGNFANTPGKNNFAVKGQSAPKPKHGDDGSNKKSPVATK